jgi:hypothetical protein
VLAPSSPLQVPSVNTSNNIGNIEHPFLNLALESNSSNTRVLRICDPACLESCCMAAWDVSGVTGAKQWEGSAACESNLIQALEDGCCWTEDVCVLLVIRAPSTETRHTCTVSQVLLWKIDKKYRSSCSH